MKYYQSCRIGALILMLGSALAGQTVPPGSGLMPPSPSSEVGFTLSPATGALVWTLPVGVVPGDITI